VPKAPPGEGAPCPSCASRNPERNNWIPACAGMTHKGGQGRPGRRQRRRPGRPRGPLSHSRASGNPGSFGCAPWCHSCASRNPVRLSPCGRGRRCPRHRRVRGPQCHSCASSSPAGVIPAKAGTQAFLGVPLGLLPAKAAVQASLHPPPVSSLRKQQSSTPLPTAGEAGGAQGTAG
jgi:hypothetical protein